MIIIITEPSSQKTSNNKWSVYIVECRDKSLYTGITNNLEKRIETHNSGKGAKYTRARRPIKLKYYEEIENKSLALKREFAIKQLTRAQKNQLINNLQK
jgi:putative endonuclease